MWGNGSTSACSLQSRYPGVGQSSPDRAGIYLTHSPAAEGPRQSCCHPACYLAMLVLASCPTQGRGCGDGGLAEDWGMGQGLLQTWAPPWLSQNLRVSGVGCPGCPTLPSLPRAFLRGVFLVCKGASQGCFALHETVPLSEGDDQSPHPCTALCSSSCCTISQPGAELVISSAQASSTFLLSVLFPLSFHTSPAAVKTGSCPLAFGEAGPDTARGQESLELPSCSLPATSELEAGQR